MISLHIEGAILEDALQRIAAKGNFKLIYGSYPVLLERRVTLHLEDVTPQEALRKALKGTELKSELAPSGHLILVKQSSVPGASRKVEGADLEVKPLKAQQPVGHSALNVRMQEGTITGTVTSAETGETLPGVNVVVAGLPEQTLGAPTGPKGQYTIEGVPVGEQTITASFVGYQEKSHTVEVVDGETVTQNFGLSPSALGLEEVVVTGTGGPVETRKLGNTVSSIETAGLANAPITNFSEMLQGRAPGVAGLPSGGMTGEGSQILIRGSASISQSNEPIVYVDGVRVDRGGGLVGEASVDSGSPSRLDDINPAAVERVEIIKGAAAATLYGTEASNGVIQIFTKTGDSDSESPKFTFQAEQGLSRFPEVYPANTGFASDAEIAQRMSDHFGQNIQPYQLVERGFMHNLFGIGHLQTYSASVSGGSPEVTYFASGRWATVDGPIDATENRGYSQGQNTRVEDVSQTGQFNVGMNIVPTDNLSFRITTAYTDRSLNTFPSSNSIRSPTSLAQFSKPELAGPNNHEGTAAFATVNEALQVTNEQNVEHFFGSIGADYSPLDMLTFDATFGIDMTNQRDVQFWPFGWNIDNFSTATVDGARYIGDRNNIQLSYDLKGRLNNQFGSQTDTGRLFESTFLAGVQLFTARSKIETATGIGFPGPGLEVVNAARDQEAAESIKESANVGVYAQEQIGYNNWVFLTVGARLDANSAFGSEFNAAFYPKVQLSLPMSDAPFWQPIGPLSTFRFRTAFGMSGLQPTTFAALNTYIPIGSRLGTGVAPGNLGNPELEPERSREYEIGMDLGFFEDRYSLKATYWNRTVTDALVNRQFAPTGGFQSLQLDNIGKLKAQGLELGLDASVFDNENTSLNLSTNLSYLWEQVADLGASPPIKVRGSYTRYRNLVTEGYAPGAHFGGKLLDVPAGHLPVDFNGDSQPDSRQEVLDYLATLTPETASLPASANVVLMADEDDDGDPLDHYRGKPLPDWRGSFGGTLSYGNFELSTHFEAAFGNYQINNLTYAFRQAHPVIGRNLPASARVERNYITGGVDANYNPQNDPNVRLEALKTWLDEMLALAPFAGVNQIEDADYLRWRELSFTYTLPPTFLQQLVGGVREASFTVAARNLALWTKYGGIDPESNAHGRGSGREQGPGFQFNQNFSKGIDIFGLPLQQRLTFTFRLGF